MLNNHVVSFYYNFGQLFKGLEDMTTNGIESWWVSTTRCTVNWCLLTQEP